MVEEIVASGEEVKVDLVDAIFFMFDERPPYTIELKPTGVGTTTQAFKAYERPPIRNANGSTSPSTPHYDFASPEEVEMWKLFEKRGEWMEAMQKKYNALKAELLALQSRSQEATNQLDALQKRVDELSVTPGGASSSSGGGNGGRKKS